MRHRYLFWNSSSEKRHFTLEHFISISLLLISPPLPHSAPLALLSLYGVCFNVLQFAPQCLSGPIVENRLVIRQYRMIKMCDTTQLNNKREENVVKQHNWLERCYILIWNYRFRPIMAIVRFLYRLMGVYYLSGGGCWCRDLHASIPSCSII